MLQRLFGRKLFMPMMDADGGGAGSQGGDGQGTGGTEGNGGGNPPAFDYDKVKSIVEGALGVKEDTVLKNYFKQQGLSQEEAQQAMVAFKQQKAAQQPDVTALQQQAQQAAAAAQQAMVEKEATLAALTLGIDAKTIPYVLKLADMKDVVGQDGKINAETLQNALKKVLEDVPVLKLANSQQNAGFQVGAPGGGNNQKTADQDALKAAFGL